MIGRLVHHAEILALKGDSYRLKDRDLASTPGPPDERERAALTPGAGSLRFERRGARLQKLRTTSTTRDPVDYAINSDNA
jgi:hypothetical protein